MTAKNELKEKQKNSTAEYGPAVSNGTGLMFGFMIGLVENIGQNLKGKGAS